MENNYQLYLKKAKKNKNIYNEVIIEASTITLFKIFMFYRRYKEHFDKLFDYIKFSKESKNKNKELIQYLEEKQKEGNKKAESLLKYFDEYNITKAFENKKATDIVLTAIKTTLGVKKDSLEEKIVNLIYKAFIKIIKNNPALQEINLRFLQKTISDLQPKIKQRYSSIKEKTKEQINVLSNQAKEKIANLTSPLKRYLPFMKK